MTNYLVSGTDTSNAAGDFTGVSCVSASSPCVVTGLTNGDTYTFTLEAVNGDGTGSPSASSTATDVDVVAGAPTITGVTVTAGTSVRFPSPRAPTTAPR